MNDNETRETSDQTSETNNDIHARSDTADMYIAKIWGSLVHEWVYISEGETSERSDEELVDIRREQLLKDREIDFLVAQEADFPNRVVYPHDSEGPFKSAKALMAHARKIAEASENEPLSKTATRAKMARILFRAIYIDPTLIRIEGMHLEKKDGEDLYRVRYSRMAESILVGISKMYGGCGIINALRLLILHIGIAFDERGFVFGMPLDELEITSDDLNDASIAIGILNNYYYHPLSKCPHVTQRRINDVRSAPICFMPKSLRLALLKNECALQSSYGDESTLKDALVKTWLEGKRHWIDYREETQIRAVENALRAVCELDGVNPRDLGITAEATPPVIIERKGITGRVTITPVEDESERRRIVETQEREQSKSSLIATSVIAVIVGVIAGFLLNVAAVIITRSEYLNYSRSATLIFIAAGAIIAFVINLVLHSSNASRDSTSQTIAADAVRSEWEEKIANHVVSKFPSLKVETNNRSVIKSRDNKSEFYEIDIWIPEIRLGIEANGERYHDHAAYRRDKQQGTINSREMYKEKYCEDKGIKLVHVWDSEDIEDIFKIIDKTIQDRMGR